MLFKLKKCTCIIQKITRINKLYWPKILLYIVIIINLQIGQDEKKWFSRPWASELVYFSQQKKKTQIYTPSTISAFFSFLFVF